jgi:hypothetical protein
VLFLFLCAVESTFFSLVNGDPYSMPGQDFLGCNTRIALSTSKQSLRVLVQLLLNVRSEKS